jgi:hypothetical protein
VIDTVIVVVNVNANDTVIDSHSVPTVQTRGRQRGIDHAHGIVLVHVRDNDHGSEHEHERDSDNGYNTTV